MMGSDFVRITKVWEKVNIMHACNPWPLYIFPDTTHGSIVNNVYAFYIIFNRLSCILWSWNDAGKIKLKFCLLFDDKVDIPFSSVWFFLNG